MDEKTRRAMANVDKMLAEVNERVEANRSKPKASGSGPRGRLATASLNRLLMDADTRAVLKSYSGRRAVDSLGGRIVEDETFFNYRFRAEYHSGVVESAVAEGFWNFVYDAASGRSIEDCVTSFRSHGFRGVYDSVSVLDSLGADSLLVYRLASDWRAGLSWAGNSAQCMSYEFVKGEPVSDLCLWAAVVPAEHVLGAHWYGDGVGVGVFPYWRIVDHRVMGRVVLPVMDFSEVWVDPLGLVEGDSLVPGVVVPVHRFDRVVPASEMESMLFALTRSL